jgi:hypothetical protein
MTALAAAAVLVAACSWPGDRPDPGSSPPTPTPTPRYPAAKFRLDYYWFDDVDRGTWAKTRRQVEKDFDRALATAEARAITDSSGNRIGVVMVGQPTREYSTASGVRALLQKQKRLAEQWHLDTDTQSIGRQVVLHFVTADVEHWYWVSGANLVLVMTRPGQNGRAFVEQFAAHTE